MSTTVGHIRGIITLDNAGYMAKSKETRADAKDLKDDVEAQKPKLDADEKPFVAAVARAEAASEGLDAKMQKTVDGLQAKLERAAKSQEDALGRVRSAQAALDALRNKEASAERIVAAEERLAAALRNVAAAEADVTAIEGQLEAARTRTVESTDEVTEAEDRATDATIEHTEARMGLVKALAASNFAIAAGAAAAGLAIAVPGLAAGVAAAMILAQNDRVADSYTDLARGVAEDARAMAAPLEDDLVDAAGTFALAWSELRPDVRALFAESSPAIREMSQGLGDLARGALPGATEAARRSGPVWIALRRMLGDVGEGAGDFFRNVSADSESTARSVEAFGQIAESALGGTGTLLQQLATSFAPYSTQFAGLVQQAINLITQLSSGALPALMDSAGFVMQALSQFLDLIEPISSEVGTSIGIILSAAAAWKVYSGALDLVAKSSVAGKLAETAVAVTPLPDKLDKTGKGAAGAAGALGLLSKAASPLGIALAATGVLMGTYILQQQAIQEGSDDFVRAIMKGGDVARQKASEYRENADALAELKRRRDEFLADAETVIDPDDRRLGEMNDAIYEQQLRVDSTRAAWDEYVGKLGPVDRAQAEVNLAIAQYGENSAEAEAAGARYRSEVDKAAAAQKAAADATKSHTEKITEQLGVTLAAGSAGLNYEAALLNVERAQKAAADAVKEHGAGSLEARQADNSYQQQLLLTIDALGKKVAAENAGKSASEISRLVTQAQYGEILRLAAAAGNDAPAALSNLVSSLDTTTLAAMGVTGRVNEAGQAVYRLPNGKEIVITGDNTDALAKIEAVNNASVRDKFFTIVMGMQVDKSGVPIAGSNRSENAAGGFNSGGWVPGDGPDRDSVTIAATPKEFVVNRKAAQRYGPFLEAINEAAGGTARLPQSMLANVPQARLAPTFEARRSVGAADLFTETGGRRGGVLIGELHLHSMRALPSADELRDVLHDVQTKYGEVRA